MKKSKSILFALMAMFVLVATSQLLSCQSKQEKNAASEQSKDSAFVFSTPKVLNIGDFIEKKNKMKRLDTTTILRLSEIADDVEYVLLKASNGKQEVFIGQGFSKFVHLQRLHLCSDDFKHYSI